MGLAGLNSALSGLKATNQQLGVISSNIANANTEGYSRKIQGQSTQVVGGVGVGVLLDGIVRRVDLDLEQDLWTQVSAAEGLNVQKKYLDRVQQFHGPPESGINIAAQFSDLGNELLKLADNPDDQFQQVQTLQQADRLVKKVNDFGNFIQESRNNAQEEARALVDRVNGLLERVAQLNKEILFNQGIGRTSADLEDQRDIAVKELSEYIEVKAFVRSDGVMSIQSSTSQELAATEAQRLVFNPPQLSSSVVYRPDQDSAMGLYIAGSGNYDAIDLTQTEVGGRIGGLLKLRDETLTQMSAQLDEFAHKMALRFNSQGLRLFTDNRGNIPADTPPTIGSTAVPYVGFAENIQLNTAVRNDPSLLQKGTYGANIPAGSNEVITRILDFAMGDVNYQLASNTDAATSVDIRAAVTGNAALGSPSTLQDWLGLQSTNKIESVKDLTGFNSVADILTAGGVEIFGANTVIDITFDDPDIGSGPYVVQIDLAAIADDPALNAGEEILAAIQADADWANIQSDFGASVSLNSQGELVIDSRSDLEIAGAAVNGLGASGFSFIGIPPQTSEATDPTFQVQVGDKDPVTITIEPTDTETELLTKLNAIDGVVAQIDADGFLSVRPGDSFTNSNYGGAIRLISSDFTTSSAALTGTAAGRAAIDDGVNVVSALFGTYSTTGGVTNISPVENVLYQSEVSNGSGTYSSFRTQYLGSNTNEVTNIGNSLNLADFAQKMISRHSQDLALVEGKISDSEVLRDLYQNQLNNESGVNIDEELSQLILMQTAYAASAQMMRSLENLFDELLAIIQ